MATSRSLTHYGRLISVLSCLLLGGCSTLNNTFDAIGGMITGKPQQDCEGDNCSGNSLLDSGNEGETWYCYGVSKEDGWECQSKADPARIVAIVPKNEAAPEAAPAPLAAPAPVPAAPARPQAVGGGETILQQPANFYTVQLIALQEEQNVLEYAQLNGISYPLYAKIRSQGSNWHVLLLGIYPDKQAAQKAKEEWEKTKTLKIKPWIRQLGPLQEAIRLAL
ncbi:MAG: SPOR domain-containing protein [Pseudomonadales bacterium]|nr:SPOR domain-containing protein [Pseudomonadales bacterium]